MTAALSVRIECGPTGELLQGAVLTQVVGTVHGTGTARSRRQVLIPVGWDVAPAEVDVPPGDYLVEAALPSGEVLSDDVEVRDGQPTNVVLELRSPFETHSMQYLVGNIEPRAVYHSPSTYPVPASVDSHPFPGLVPFGVDDLDAARPAADVAVLSRGTPSPPPLDLLDGLRTLPVWDAAAAVRAALGPQGAALGPPREPVPLQPEWADSAAPLYRLDERLRLRREVAWSDHRCHYVLVAAGDAAYLVTAPWPWPREDRPVAVELMVNLRQGPTGSAVSVTVQDPVVGAGLGYLAEGSLEKAAVVFADVEAMLYAKVSNPVAAAAGAYVLVGRSTGKDGQRWDPWLANLRAWFPELSDGAVLWGARRLRTAREPAHLDEAKAAFLEGYRRGLPVFTLGLTWLLDGLSHFPDDEDCAAALAHVHRLSWRVDMREPFVVLRLGADR